MDFRERICEDFAVIFNDETKQNESENNEFGEKWGWFGVMYRLTGGDFSKLEFITERPLLEALTWLSYEIDLNETKKVQINGNR